VIASILHRRNMKLQSSYVVESVVEGEGDQINVHIALHISFETMRHDVKVEE
jgi:hypothetical protein